MSPLKLDVFVAFFCYGGNGGIGMQLPEITMWWAKTSAEMLKDERIGRVECMRFGDIPLTMERNRAVRTAKDRGFDVIVMIDSDNVPDLYEGLVDNAKPFWSTSFDFLYARAQRGLPSVVAAPYCGPPPHPTKGGMENVYVFHGEEMESDNPNSHFRFVAYSRQQASQMVGIQAMGAGPTGCIVYTLNAFDVMPVHSLTQEEILLQFQAGEIPLQRAARLLNMQSWFFYEYTNGEQTEKASTEDVTNTREIQMAGMVKYNEPIVFCNWDAWAGHYKPKCVGKPTPVYVEQVNELYREAVENNLSQSEKMQNIDFTHGATIHALPADDEDGKPLHINGTPIPGVKDAWDIKEYKRIINGRLCTSIGCPGGGQTPRKHLDAIAEVVALAAMTNPERALRIVEVGSWVGESAIAMHAGFGPAGGTIFCVDTWEGSPTDLTGDVANVVGHEAVFARFCENTGDLLDKSIKAIKGDSVRVAETMDQQDLDMVFVDAGHDYEQALADIKAWMRHLGTNGIMCGHDFCDVFPGVVQAVKEVTNAAGILPRLVNGTSVWMFTKKEYDEGMAKQTRMEQERFVKAKRSKKVKEEVASEPVAANS